MPTGKAAANAGAVTGIEAERSTVSNVTSPTTSARPSHENHGANARGVTVSGRRYCSPAVGRNSTPNSVPSLAARAARRSAEKSLSTCLSNGTLNGESKRATLTDAYSSTGTAAASAIRPATLQSRRNATTTARPASARSGPIPGRAAGGEGRRSDHGRPHEVRGPPRLPPLDDALEPEQRQRRTPELGLVVHDRSRRQPQQRRGQPDGRGEPTSCPRPPPLRDGDVESAPSRPLQQAGTREARHGEPGELTDHDQAAVRRRRSRRRSAAGRAPVPTRSRGASRRRRRSPRSTPHRPARRGVRETEPAPGRRRSRS